ncbi:hypothetical protein J4Q44_G00126040 [Coregonus suidteri]|uniref:Uncharacterized protein n=1 Tax=Coregonus suidteri TaxID=861788 RepID=A0AAN8LVV2_9TELE
MVLQSLLNNYLRSLQSREVSLLGYGTLEQHIKKICHPLVSYLQTVPCGRMQLSRLSKATFWEMTKCNKVLYKQIDVR